MCEVSEFREKYIGHKDLLGKQIHGEKANKRMEVVHFCKQNHQERHKSRTKTEEFNQIRFHFPSGLYCAYGPLACLGFSPFPWHFTKKPPERQTRYSRHKSTCSGWRHI